MNIYQQGRMSEELPAEAIVVLGASQWNGTPSPAFEARLDHALKLYNQGLASSVLLTGGLGKDETISESAVGKDYLSVRGVNENVIFIEEQSRTTLQNLRQAMPIFNEHGFNTILLVSHDFHMMRAKKMAEDLGLTAYAASVATKNKIRKLEYSLREVVVYWMYLLFRI